MEPSLCSAGAKPVGGVVLYGEYLVLLKFLYNFNRQLLSSFGNCCALRRMALTPGQNVIQICEISPDRHHVLPGLQSLVVPLSAFALHPQDAAAAEQFP